MLSTFADDPWSPEPGAESHPRAAAGTSQSWVGPGDGGFLCFALSFCILVQVAFWRFYNPTQVEDAVLDTYDFVYDQAMKSPSSNWWQELAVIQDTFLCCGKKSPFGLLVSTGAIMCQGREAMREVYAMMLCAFLWFAIHSYHGLDRKGRYSLTPPRSHGFQTQEPSLFRWT